MSLFVDTWGWLSLADPCEPLHGSVAQFFREESRVPKAVVTSDYVLDELITRLFRRRPFPGAAEFVEGILLSVARGHYILAPVNELRFARALHLRRKFSDKPRISFTDLTSMAIMQELRVLDVLTADENFLQAGMGFRIHPD